MDLDDDACYRALRTRDARFDGRFFTGVRTTGVYCRPVCPARTPRRENVVFYPTAAAAQQAGFRPCLRCRPEASPELAVWRGTSNTVARALLLLENGTFGEGGVEELAARLGVGGRQLRRLFLQHLGASPVAVAQTRRVLLAKQLIHDTRLPMAEIALASGFGSVRRFNETFQRLFGRPPSALRRAGAAIGISDEPGAIRVRLPFRAPYDDGALRAFLAARAIPGVEAVRGLRYARSIAIGGARGVVFVEPGDGAWLEATIRFPDLAALPAIRARLRRVFDLGADPVAIDEHLGRDPALASCVAARPGLRVPGAWDGFELGVRAILGQQITVPAARALAGRLTAAFGAHLDDPRANAAGVTRVFPDPAALVDADLAALGLPRARARALRAFARAVADDPSLLTAHASLAEAVARLSAIEGIGAWTAHYIAMRQLAEPDAFPEGDVALARALGNLEGPRPSRAALVARAEAWRPWRAYAAVHLWTSLAPSTPARKATHARVA